MQTEKEAVAKADIEEIRRLVRAASEQGDHDQYAGKRGTTRVEDAVLLEVTTDPEQPSASWTVYMHNISEAGLALWSRRNVTVRTFIFVRECSEDELNPWLPAYVTHCTMGIRGYLIGAAFE